MARARWIKRQGYTKVGLMWLTSPTAEEDVEYFGQEAKKFGMTIVANEQHKGNDTDMSVQLTRIAAAKPDVIWFVTFPHQGAIMAKNIKSLGINIPLLGCYGMTSEAWINIAKETAEGWYGCVVSHGLGDQTPPWYPTYPIVKAYADSYHKRFGETITATSGNAYDSVYMIAAGLKKMGEEPDVVKGREKLARAIENLENFFCLNGPYYMSPNNHNGTGEWAISIVKVVNGKMVIQN
jgi:branched-chain amino acid transport system substrate-binding protein